MDPHLLTETGIRSHLYERKLKMNRSTVRNTASLERAPVCLYMNVAIGATGAPTLNNSPKNLNLGIVSMVRTGVGAYTINLGLSATSVDTYQRLLIIDHVLLSATDTSSDNLVVVADNSANLTAPNVQIAFFNSGSAVEIPSGSTLLLKLELSNTTAI
jgi:hypothetical protein